MFVSPSVHDTVPPGALKTTKKHLSLITSEVLADAQDGDRIFGGAQGGCGPEFIWEIPVKGNLLSDSACLGTAMCFASPCKSVVSSVDYRDDIAQRKTGNDTMAVERQCSKCNNSVPPSEALCPHCMNSVGFPNVDTAKHPDKKSRLKQEYDSAMHNCRSRNCDAKLVSFEKDVCDNSKAVMAKQLGEVNRLAVNERQMIATYFQQIRGKSRLSDGDEWDYWRRFAGTALFCGYEEDIQFAFLSLDEHGSHYYGNMHMVLKTALIHERSSVFFENSALHVKKADYPVSQLPQLPGGIRAEWSDRGKLAAAKHYKDICPSTQPTYHPQLLFQPGAKGWDDDFIEVHIYGTITIQGVEKVVYLKPRTRPLSKRQQKKQKADRAEVEALKERLSPYGIAFEEVES